MICTTFLEKGKEEGEGMILVLVHHVGFAYVPPALEPKRMDSSLVHSALCPILVPHSASNLPIGQA